MFRNLGYPRFLNWDIPDFKANLGYPSFENEIWDIPENLGFVKVWAKLERKVKNNEEIREADMRLLSKLSQMRS